MRLGRNRNTKWNAHHSTRPVLHLWCLQWLTPPTAHCPLLPPPPLSPLHCRCQRLCHSHHHSHRHRHRHRHHHRHHQCMLPLPSSLPSSSSPSSSSPSLLFAIAVNILTCHRSRHCCRHCCRCHRHRQAIALPQPPPFLSLPLKITAIPVLVSGKFWPSPLPGACTTGAMHWRGGRAGMPSFDVISIALAMVT